MKKLITTIFILLVFIKCSSSKFKTISISEINFEVNKINNKPLDSYQ